MIGVNDIRTYVKQARAIIYLRLSNRKHNAGTRHDYVDGYLDGCRDSYNAILEYLDAFVGGDRDEI